MLTTQSQRQNIARDAKFDALVDSVTIAEGLLTLADGHPLTGAWREINQHMDHTYGPGEHFGALRVPFRKIPGYVQRADTVASASAGGFLAETENGPITDAIRAAGGLLAKRGAVIIEAGRANINIPRVNGTTTAYALPTESTTITAGSHTYGQAALEPKTFGTFNELSRQLLLQTNGVARDFAALDQARVLARTMDHQALLGSGLNGECTGLAKLATSFSGSSLALSGLQSTIVSIGDALNDTFGYISSTAAASVLRQRSEISGSSVTLWTGSILDGKLNDAPASSSSNITGLFAGSWNYLAVALWGGGFSMQVNPYGTSSSQFQAGIIGIRTLLTMDAAPMQLSAFSYASSVS